MVSIEEFIKERMMEKGMSLAKLAENLYITKQGLHKMLHGRSDGNFKLQQIKVIADILDFGIYIKGGKIKIIESIDERQELEMYDVNGKVSYVEREVSIGLFKCKDDKEYEVVMDFGEVAIVKLYTLNGNLSYDTNPVLLEDCYAASIGEIDECWVSGDEVVELYGILVKGTEEIMERSIRFGFYSVLEYYYFNYATPIEEIDGYDVLGQIDDYKVALGYAIGQVVDSCFYEKEISPVEVADFPKEYTQLQGIVFIKQNGTLNEKEWYASVEDMFLYGDTQDSSSKNRLRFYDGDYSNRHELYAGDYIEYCFDSVNLELASEVGENRVDLVDDFNKGDIFQIYKENGKLCINRDDYIQLEKLNLLKWGKIVK